MPVMGSEVERKKGHSILTVDGKTGNNLSNRDKMMYSHTLI